MLIFFFSTTPTPHLFQPHHIIHYSLYLDILPNNSTTHSIVINPERKQSNLPKTPYLFLFMRNQPSFLSFSTIHTILKLFHFSINLSHQITIIKYSLQLPATPLLNCLETSPNSSQFSPLSWSLGQLIPQSQNIATLHLLPFLFFQILLISLHQCFYEASRLQLYF